MTSRHLYILLALMLMSVTGALAQTVDTDYEYKADDYAPAEISHCNLKRSLAGAGMGLVINASLTELLKFTVSETRPDGSDDSSFPSRHSSYTFAATSIVFHELATRWAIWAPIAQTAANAVAMQRAMSQAHYPSDILAGAALGLASAEIGYGIAGLLFDCDKAPRYLAGGNRSALQAYTTALIPLASHSGPGLATGCGIEAALGVTTPTSTYAGTIFTIVLRDMPVYFDSLYIGMLKSFGVKNGFYMRRDLGSNRWACEGSVALGVLRNFSRPMSVAPSWSWLAEVSGSIYRRVSRNFSVGLRGGYDWTNRFDTNSSVTISFVSRAEF